MRLLGQVVDAIGEEEALALLPRLCFLALQSPAPAPVFMGLYDRLTAENSATDLAASPPEAFCQWAGADPERLRNESVISSSGAWIEFSDGSRGWH